MVECGNASRKLIVFLHGFGFDGSENPLFKDAMVKRFPEWDYISFDAPFPSGRDRGGYAWFDITKGDRRFVLDDGKLDQSIVFLQEGIHAELEKRELSWKDLILVGRSQGAFLSILLASMSAVPCYAVVCTGSLFIPCDQFKLNSTPPIFWFEMEDEKLPQEKTEGYKYLISQGCDVTYAIGKNSDHDFISPETTDDIIKALEG
ncbi:MAG: hypothetical protein OXR68_03370 [Alphaproteobacteria bacterium]|nr:hypothetical protein [Alphaproteobacteria bacterium]MDD9919646.1 hypothetical protein [Alphaproteobacteria bacterium]